MKIRIKETNEIVELTFLDRKTGICCARDIIGNNGAFCPDQIDWDDDADMHVCSRAEYEWWETYFDRQTRADIALDELEDELGPDAVADVLANCGSVDLEDQPAVILTAIEEYRSDKAKS